MTDKASLWDKAKEELGDMVQHGRPPETLDNHFDYGDFTEHDVSEVIDEAAEAVDSAFLAGVQWALDRMLQMETLS